ncbi:response regulator transcription factor [Polaromonas sp. P2-4]|nr:response regulator transcription factor [Polaromonas sp. P2-4]
MHCAPSSSALRAISPKISRQPPWLWQFSSAAAGGKHISPELAEKLVNAIGRGDAAPHEALSDRELEVLKLLASGERLVRIAEILHLSPSTVTTYRARILEKTGMDSNARLARYALENGLLT